MDARSERGTTAPAAGRKAAWSPGRVWVAWAIYFGVLCAVALATLRGAA